MEKKFRVLRIIGTVWKILAWIELIIGVLISFGALLAGLVGGLAQGPWQLRQMPMGAQGAGVLGGVAGFIGLLIITVIYFLALYAVGEMIYLALAIEENTRATSQWVQRANSASQPRQEVPYQSPPGPPSSGPQ